MLAVALTAVAAQAQVTVDAGAETMPVPSFVAADPAIGSYVIGTDGAQTGFFAYEQTGALKATVAVGLSLSADIRAGVLAVAVPNSGILFFHEANPTQPYSLPDGGPANITYSTASHVALGVSGGGATLVFANGGGSTLATFVLGGEALPTVTLPGVPRGLAWGNGQLYATVPGALVSVDGEGMVSTVAASNLGAADGVAIIAVGDASYALVASSSDSRIYVHRVSGTPEFIGTFSVTFGTSTVTPKSLAANASTLVVQDNTAANYKLVALSDVVSAMQLSNSGSDGGTTTNPDGGGGNPQGPNDIPGGGPSAPLNPACGVTSPLLLLPAALLLLLFRRRGVR